MAASKADLINWFNEGVALGNKRMIVWCDTFDYEEYPEYTDLTGAELRAYANRGGTDRLMEVYDLTADLDWQMSLYRAFNY